MCNSAKLVVNDPLPVNSIGSLELYQLSLLPEMLCFGMFSPRLLSCFFRLTLCACAGGVITVVCVRLSVTTLVVSLQNNIAQCGTNS